MTHSNVPDSTGLFAGSITSSKDGLVGAVQPFVDKGIIAGAVLLAATKDRVLALDTVGYSDLATKQPMAPDSLFWIASMTKPMTATALMMLVDEGKVNVDDPVEKYLPEFKGQMFVAEQDEEHVLLKKPRHPILVREVLNHTGGLLFSLPVEAPTYDQLPLRTSIRAYASAPLVGEPGAGYRYSNAGTNTAGRIIEVVSGLAYEDFMDQRLFHPLGMDDTTFWPSEKQLSRLAGVYRSKDDKSGLEETRINQLSYPLNDPRRKPMPAGGLFSTASDVARFCRMILNGGSYDGRRYLSEAAIREMTRKQTGDSIETAYGYGWQVEGETFGHGGACKTRMTINPMLGLVTVFLIHHANEWHSPEGNDIQPAFAAAAEKLIA
jgi:CubicO group peptidase (beta-lactamase class C family)